MKKIEKTYAMAVRIAMWSGPRNISTALMRSWGSRSDCHVTDEPLYAHYLLATGLDHPGREATLARHETDWRRVVSWLTGPVPDGKTIWYQKHMAHHLLPDVGRDWLDELTHAFLIRDPREMLLSLAEFLPDIRVEDTGLPQQVELFRRRRARGDEPAVVDSRDVLLAPEPTLRALCARLGVPFDRAMLRWEPGLRETDGAWAPYWYAKVEQTTTFGRYEPKEEPLPERLRPVYDACLPLYEELAQAKICPDV